MSMGFRADPTNTSGVITVAGVDQVVITNASNVVATTFTGALAGNATTATALSTASGAAPSYGARAWVNFDGTRDTSGAASSANTNRFIRAQGNVGSVLKIGDGLYAINFATPMASANYAAVFGANPNNFNGVFAGSGLTSGGTNSPTQCFVELRDAQNTTSYNSDYIMCAIFL